jgi:hypothetical protein
MLPIHPPQGVDMQDSSADAVVAIAAGAVPAFEIELAVTFPSNLVKVPEPTG